MCALDTELGWMDLYRVSLSFLTCRLYTLGTHGHNNSDPLHKLVCTYNISPALAHISIVTPVHLSSGRLGQH